MPAKHFYFSIGASIGSIAMLYINVRKEQLVKRFSLFKQLEKQNSYWYLYSPLIIFFFGVWGLIPDIIHALSILPKEVTRTEVFNLFYFHSYFEYIEDTNKDLDQILNWIGQLILIVISLGTIMYYISLVNDAVKNFSGKEN